MPKRSFSLSPQAGGFYDEQTGLKVLPGEVVVLDTGAVGPQTALAITHGGLIEVDTKAAKADAKAEADAKAKAEADAKAK